MALQSLRAGLKSAWFGKHEAGRPCMRASQQTHVATGLRPIPRWKDDDNEPHVESGGDGEKGKPEQNCLWSFPHCLRGHAAWFMMIENQCDLQEKKRTKLTCGQVGHQESRQQCSVMMWRALIPGVLDIRFDLLSGSEIQRVLLFGTADTRFATLYYKPTLSA